MYESGRDASERVPLVVNTMGWTKGFGGDLLKRIEELVMPTHVISIGEASEPRGEDILQAANTTTYPSTSNGIEPSEPTTISVESIPVDNTGSSSRYTASDWRALSLMSYFHSSLQPSKLAKQPRLRSGDLKFLQDVCTIRNLPFLVDVVPSR